jgi:hypothetical protein
LSLLRAKRKRQNESHRRPYPGQEPLSLVDISHRHSECVEYLVKHADILEQGIKDNPVYYAVEYAKYYHRLDEMILFLYYFSPMLEARYKHVRDLLDSNLMSHKESKRVQRGRGTPRAKRVKR